MHRHSEFGAGSGTITKNTPAIVVAGPSSSLTIPGIIVSQIVQAISERNSVLRIEVDSATDFDAGLHRSPSLAAAHHSAVPGNIVSYVAPGNSRLRAQAFEEWIPRDARAAIAFAWPGLDNSWIGQFLASAKVAGTPSMVVCVSLPKSNLAKVAALAEAMSEAELVLVGNATEADALSKAFGTAGPVVETHRALSLQGRAERSSIHQITAFLQRDNYETLATLLTAYDAIPEAWIDSYRLQVVMRYTGDAANRMVAESYHGDFVRLVGDDLSSEDMRHLCATSSALIIADPAFDSRAFTIAMDCGVGIVVLASAQLPDIGRGYVGALLADLNRPVSVHVALTHALRLAELHFPRPDAWNELVDRLLGAPVLEAIPTTSFAPTAHAGSTAQ